MAGITKKGKSYYALFKLGRKTKWKKIGAMPYKDAIRRLKDLEADFDKTYGSRDIKPISFTNFAREFLVYREANFAKRTWERDRASIKALSSHFD
ncbi:MAG: hypothetical protein ACRENW_08540, partial [Thermodesulfobacteriota bacterium]